MRKNIDIDDSIVKDLKRLAVENDQDLKNFIQDLLKDLVKKHYNTPGKTRRKILGKTLNTYPGRQPGYNKQNMHPDFD